MAPLKTASGPARACLREAQDAANSGTFGVGAVLVDDRTRDVLDAVSNEVVRELPSGRTMAKGSSAPSRATHDPTAHGERQLITRYFERARRGLRLPPPAGLTIVSSLEPCAMCAGAILTAGFKVGVVALDPVAGIGASGSSSFEGLPDLIRRRAEGSFGYYEVPGVRSFVGTSRVAFGGDEKARVVSRKVHDGCEKTFLDSLERAMAVVSERAQASQVIDLASLESGDPLRVFLAEKFPHFLSLRLPDPRDPSREVLELLRALAEGEPGRGSSSALIDPFGNLLIASGGGPVDDPIDTGFANVIRTYSRTRFELATDPVLSGPASKYLTHPKFGTIFRYPVPDPDSPVTLFELGAYGSTMEGPLPRGCNANLRFIGEGVDEERSRDELLALVEAMPPFYSETVGLDLEVTSF